MRCFIFRFQQGRLKLCSWDRHHGDDYTKCKDNNASYLKRKGDDKSHWTQEDSGPRFPWGIEVQDLSVFHSERFHAPNFMLCLNSVKTICDNLKYG